MSKIKNNVGVNPTKIMANMSATILRSIVASVFKVNPNSVQLSGELSPEFIPQNDRGHSWWDGASKIQHNVWGFSPETGFVCIAGNTVNGIKESTDKLKREYKYSQNGDVYHKDGEPLHSHPDATKFAFFIINSDGKSYGEPGEYYSDWTLYKAPNFKTFMESGEASDINRWSAWVQA